MATYAPNQLHSVPLAELQADPTQPRKYLDPLALEELTASIGQIGIIEPIVCRQDPQTGLVYVVAGERRCAAARKAGLAAVPALFIEGDQTGWLCGTGCLQIALEGKRLLPEFFYYYMEQQEVVSWLEQHAVGTTMLNLSMSIVAELPLKYPSANAQAPIADTLSAYDDLIENNRRRMALLEDAARQLYREWFVRLRFPGHEHTRITNGVPDGRKRKPIADLALFLKRGITPHYDEDAESLVINQKCIRNCRLDVMLARRQSREFKPDYQVQRGDVLVNSTGQGTLGRVAQVLTTITSCTVDTHVTIVRPMQNAGTHYFGLAVMEWEPQFSKMGRGATNQTELSPIQIGAVKIFLPAHSLIKQF